MAVLADLHLDLEAGKFYALLGKNGSGKSTLMRILAHREPVDAGELSVLGVGIEDDFGAVANDLGFISEVNFLPVDTRIEKILQLHSKVFCRWNAEAAARLVEAFNLDLRKKAPELSRGQQVQVGLVLALSHDPKLILLDEVTSVLDASAREILMRELRDRRDRGATILLSSNIVSEVIGHATDYILLGEQKLKFTAPADEISDYFVKLRRPGDSNHPLFGVPNAVEVSVGTDGTAQILAAKADLQGIQIAPEMICESVASPNEIFIYLSRLRG